MDNSNINRKLDIMEEKQIRVDDELRFKYVMLGGVYGTYYSYVQPAVGYTSLKLKGKVKT